MNSANCQARQLSPHNLYLAIQQFLDHKRILEGRKAQNEIEIDNSVFRSPYPTSGSALSYHSALRPISSNSNIAYRTPAATTPVPITIQRSPSSQISPQPIPITYHQAQQQQQLRYQQQQPPKRDISPASYATVDQR